MTPTPDQPGPEPAQPPRAIGGGVEDDAHLVGDGDADPGLGGRPRRHARDGRPRSRVGADLRPARDRVPLAGVAGIGRARLGLAGRRLQLGVGGDLSEDGVRRNLVSVRTDDLLLPGAARLRRQHPGVRVRALLGAQRPLHDGGDHRRVLVGRAGLRQRGALHRPAGVVRDLHRHADPRPASGPAGRDLSPAGQRLGGAAERPPRAPALARPDECRADRQQLLPLRRGRGQRCPRRRAARCPAGVPQSDPPRRGTDPARLRPPDAGDLGRGPRVPHQLHRGRHAGVQEPARSLRAERADADHRRLAGGRLAPSGSVHRLTGPSTGLLHIARERGYLPPYFQELNS